MRILLSLLIPLLCLSCGNTDKKSKTTPIKIQQSDGQTPLAGSMARGSTLYQDLCVECHMPQGQGVTGTFPPLAGSDWLTEKRTESIYAIKFGQQGAIEVNGIPYNGVMTTMGLSDEEVADVMNFIMNSWGNSQSKMVTTQEVALVEK